MAQPVALALAVLSLCAGAVSPSSAGGGGACKSMANTDTVEKYYAKKSAANASACCAMCSADTSCNYAAFQEGQKKCYMKDGKTLTPHTLAGVILLIVREEPAEPPAPPATSAAPAASAAAAGAEVQGRADRAQLAPGAVLRQPEGWRRQPVYENIQP